MLCRDTVLLESSKSWVHPTQAPKIQDWHTKTLCLLASSGPLVALGRWLTPALAPHLQAVPVAEPMPRDPAPQPCEWAGTETTPVPAAAGSPAALTPVAAAAW